MIISFKDFVEDSSLYEYSDNSNDSSSSTITGTNASDSFDYSGDYSTSYTISGYSGDDILIGGGMGDIIFGGLGSDTLTGSYGADQFYYTDNSEGTDTITDFDYMSDSIVYSGSISSSYTRSSMLIDSGNNGSTYDISTDTSGDLAYLFNFTANTSNYATASNVASHLSGFKVTTDGANAISTSETYFITIGDGTDSSLYLWEDTGNGLVAASELNELATLTALDNDFLTGTELSLATLSI